MDRKRRRNGEKCTVRKKREQDIEREGEDREKERGRERMDER